MLIRNPRTQDGFSSYRKFDIEADEESKRSEEPAIDQSPHRIEADQVLLAKVNQVFAQQTKSRLFTVSIEGGISGNDSLI